MAGDTMRKKIIGASVAFAFLVILCVQSVIAQPLNVYVWTDKTQYKPGEKGVLKISILNELDEPVEIHNITIRYPWFSYDAKKGEWVGNKTIKGKPLATITSKDTETDHYYTEVEFTVPTDGRVAQLLTADTVSITIGTSKGPIYETVPLVISGVSLPVSIIALDTWMTSLIVAIVVCTIILAIVVILSKRRARAPRALVPRASVPPPPPKPTKPKAKTG